MKKVFAAMAVMLSLMFAVLCADAGTEESFLCYFTEVRPIRAQIDSGEYIKTIPHYTVVEITPVSGRIASVTYDGVSGYVFCEGAKRLPAESPLDTVVYADGNMRVFDYPFSEGSQIDMIPGETPIIVTHETLSYYRVSYNGKDGYIHRRGTNSIPADKMITPTEIYARSAVPVRKLPVAGADVVYTMEPNQVYKTAAMCRTYYKISWGSEEGYVSMADVLSFAKDTAQLRVGIIDEGAMLYEKPDAAFLSDVKPENRIYFIDGDNNGFCHIQDNGLYAEKDSVKSWTLEKMPVCQLYPGESVALRQYPALDAPLTGTVMEKGKLYQASYTVGDYYLLATDGNWGFARADEVSRLLMGEVMNRTAAVACADASFFRQDGTHGEVNAGEKLFITQTADDFYCCTNEEGESGFILAEDVTLTGSDAPCDPYFTMAPEDVIVYDFPSADIRVPVGTIPKGSPVKVTGFNRCYLTVESGDISGYADQTGLLGKETEGIPAGENVPKYELVLDKSARMIYAFVLDESGERTGEIAMSGLVAIGKRTTPTPSGTFTLTFKERWHTFKNSFTPHTTTYTKGKFIHGLPCQKKSEGTVIDYLAHKAGRAVTGGCLRSPFEIAKWVYFNCPSYQTTFIVVNGGVETQESPATSTDIATITDIATVTDIATATDAAK